MQRLTRELEFETLLTHSSASTRLSTHDYLTSSVRVLTFPLEHLRYFTLEHLLANIGIFPLHLKLLASNYQTYVRS